MKKYVNKLGVLEIVTKPKNYALIIQNMVVVPPNLLNSGASNMCPSSPCNHHQGTPFHVLWEPSPTSNTQGENFGTHIFLGPLGLALCKEPKNFYA